MQPFVHRRLKAALQKLMEGDEKAQDDFDKWDKFIQNHPEHVKAKEEEAKAWVENNRLPNEEACKTMKTFVPPNIYQSNLKELKKHLPEKIAQRIFTRKVLWLIRAEKTAIANIHIAELKTKYQANALDIVELRAVVSALPPFFENDADGAKLGENRQDVKKQPDFPPR